MKNIKVTYLGSNYSKKLSNLLSPDQEATSYTATFEYNNISDKTCEDLEEQLEMLDFVMKVEVTDETPSEAKRQEDHQPQGTPKKEENKLL